MKSGIYKLTFPSGKFYIGKSNNMERRWDEHYTKLSKGTGSKLLQQEFNIYGKYDASVVIHSHEDHIDIAEAYFINKLWSTDILNGVRPAAVLEDDYNVLSEYITYGTIMHCNMLSTLTRDSESLVRELEAIKQGTIVGTLEGQIEDLLAVLQDRGKELERLRSRGFWSRLLNL